MRQARSPQAQTTQARILGALGSGCNWQTLDGRVQMEHLKRVVLAQSWGRVVSVLGRIVV